MINKTKFIEKNNLVQKLCNLQFMKSCQLYRYGYPIHTLTLIKNRLYMTECRYAADANCPSIDVRKIKDFKHALNIISSWGFTPLDYSFITISNYYFNLLFSKENLSFLTYSEFKLYQKNLTLLNDFSDHLVEEKVDLAITLYSLIETWNSVDSDLDYLKRLNLQIFRETISLYYQQVTSLKFKNSDRYDDYRAKYYWQGMTKYPCMDMQRCSSSKRLYHKKLRQSAKDMIKQDIVESEVYKK